MSQGTYIILNTVFGMLVLYGIWRHYKGRQQGKRDIQDLAASDLNGVRLIAAKSRVEDHTGRMLAKVMFLMMLPLSWAQPESERLRPMTLSGKLSAAVLIGIVVIWDVLAYRLEKARQKMLKMLEGEGFEPWVNRRGEEETGE